MVSPNGDSIVVDFVASTDEGGTLVARLKWWTVDEPLGAYLVITNEMPLTETAQDDVWEIEGVATFSRIDNPFDQQQFDMNRRDQDINRGDYLKALRELHDTFPDRFGLEPWIAAVLERPTIDVAVESAKRNLGLRKIAGVDLRNVDNELVDVLVVDEHGNAATVTGHPWMQSVAEGWVYREERPTITEFADWLEQQEPTGSDSLDTVRVSEATGHIEDLARQRYTKQA